MAEERKRQDELRKDGMGELSVCFGKFTGLSQKGQVRGIEFAGNGDENHQTTVLAFPVSSFRRAGT